MNNPLTRIAVDVILFASILNGWWFIAMPLVILVGWFFPFFIELLIAGVMYDALFGFTPSLGIAAYQGTISAAILFIALFILKKVMRT
jgi:hypothetical protein